MLHLKRQIVQSGAAHGLTDIQTLTLLLINGNKTTTMNTLRSHFGCDASNITGIIDGLERKKLVVRQGQQADRRIKEIRLLPAGAKVYRAIAADLAEREGSLLSGLDADEVGQLTGLLQKIANALEPDGCPLRASHDTVKA